MRWWHQWTSEEKSFFTRLNRDTKQEHLTPSELFTVLKLQQVMVDRPLTEDELIEANDILDSVDAGFLSKQVA